MEWFLALRICENLQTFVQGRSQDFSKRGSRRLLTRSPSGDRRLYIWFIPLLSLVYQRAQSRSRLLSRIIAAWRPILTKTKDKSRWRKYLTKKKKFLKSGLFNNGFYGQDIFMAFSPPEYCRLFAQKKAYQGSRDPPWLLLYDGVGGKFVSPNPSYKR